MRSILVISVEWLCRLLFSLPRFRWAGFLKATCLRLLGAKVGKRVIFYPGVWILPGRGLDLGDDVDLALDVLITTGGGVKIGDRVLIGYRTQIISANHKIPRNRRQIFNAGHNFGRVTVESDVWIGANCMLLPGITIGSGAVVGAGSVVTKDVPSYSVVAGNPARIVRQRLIDNEQA